MYARRIPPLNGKRARKPARVPQLFRRRTTASGFPGDPCSVLVLSLRDYAERAAFFFETQDAQDYEFPNGERGRKNCSVVLCCVAPARRKVRSFDAFRALTRKRMGTARGWAGVIHLWYQRTRERRARWNSTQMTNVVGILVR